MVAGPSPFNRIVSVIINRWFALDRRSPPDLMTNPKCIMGGVTEGVLSAGLRSHVLSLPTILEAGLASRRAGRPLLLLESVGRTICDAGWYGPNYGAVAGDVGDQRCRRLSNLLW